jgi:sulfite reductase (NADPH) flavoprotein alpha-component
MAADVERALLHIITQEGGMSEDEGKAYLKTMTSEKRYVRDVY